ncbi:MAG: gliding motility-associated C-terminal domain-containing protein [Flavobacteriales bacterium]|nr:gliding motility-associated C-terminal domain-containing protein [Flavobacteriales bacterium]
MKSWYSGAWRQWFGFGAGALLPALLTAQPTCSIQLGNDTTICQGQTVTLSGPPGFPNYMWSNGAVTQNITVGTTGNYNLQVSYPTGNLVTNGNFSGGNTGFSTMFNYNSTLTTDGNYWIGNNAALYHPQWAGTGNGPFLLVNAGWMHSGWRFWCQTQTVCPGQTYTIQFRAMSLASQGNPTLAVFVNNVWTGVDHVLPAAQGVWGNYSTTWTAPGGVTSADFCVQVSSGWGIGNDFGFDDVQISSTVVLSDAQQVTVTPLPVFDLGPNATLCTGQSLTLDAAVAGGSYLWQNGSTASSFNVTTPGLYNVTVTANNCSASDAINVAFNPTPAPNLGPDLTLCTGQSQILNAITPGATYVWQDGSTAPTFNVTGPGTYDVTVVLNNCVGNDAIDIAYNPTPVVNLGADQQFCAGGQVVLDATTAGASYLWNNGSTGATLAATTTGNYSVGITVNGCTGTDAVDVNVVPLPAVNIGPDQTVCPGTAVTLNATTPGATYVWSDGSTGATLTTAAPGNYNVQVTVNGCSATDAMALTNHVLPAFSLGADQTICAGSSANLSVNVAGATYAWSTGATGNAIAPGAAGIYWVDVTTNGCTVRDSAEVFVTPLPAVALGNDYSICPGTSTTLDASLAGANYLWSTGAVTPTISVGTGNYSVTVTANGCSNNDAVTIGSYPAAAVNLGPDVTLCPGDDLLLNVAQPGASYLWQDGSTAGTYLIQSAGPVSVQLTDANGCVATDAMNANYAAPVAIDLGPDQNICPGDVVTLDATVPGASYLWSTGAITPTINASSTGNYSVTVTQGSCTVNDAINIAVVTAPVINLGADQTLCPGDAIVLDATTPGVSYQWSTGAQTPTIAVGAGGTYSVTLTNAAGCTGSDAVDIIAAAPGAINLGPDATLCQGQTITLDATLPGATYSWSTGATTPTTTVGSTGTYSVTATQGACNVTDAIDVMVNPMPQVDLGPDQTICAGTAATLDATYPGATYTWSTGAVAPSINVSAAGTYSVTVDLNGCTATDAVDIGVLSLSAIDLGPDATLCQGQTITLDATMPGVTYAWNTGATTPTITVSSTGIFNVTATQDACSVSDAISVTVNPLPQVDLGVDQTLCAGDNAVLDATYPGASYTWSTGAITPSINVNTAGTYSVMVDLNGCAATDAIDIGVLGLNAIDLGPDATLCQGQTITLDATMPGMTYAWSTGETTPTITVGSTNTYSVIASQGSCSVGDAIDVTVNPMPQVDLGADQTICEGEIATLDASYPGAGYSWSTGSTAPSIPVSSASTYSVTVDLNGCTASDAIDIAVVVPGVFDLGNDVQLCAGDQVVYALGIPGASYLWSTGATTSSISVNSTSTVWVEVTQSVCVSTDTVDVNVLDPGAMELGSDITVCEGTPVVLDATVPNATYLWSNGATTPQLNVTSNGSYSVTATVAQCTITDEIDVTINPVPVVDIGGNQSICPGSSASFDATTPGASYMWQDGSTASTYSGSSTQTVSVTVTVNGCSTADNAAIDVLPSPLADLGNDTTICEGASLLLDVSQTGATYTWSDGDMSGTRTITQAGTYAVIVDLNGCMASDAITVEVFDMNILDLGPDQLHCPGELATLSTGVAGGTQTWSTGASGSSITVSQSGSYWAQVQVAACTVRDTVLIAYVPLIAPDLGDDIVICEGDTLPLAVLSNGATVLWSNGSTTDTLLVSTTGNYAVTLTMQGCSSTDAVQVTVREWVGSLSLGNDSTYCPEQPLVLDATIAGADYAWSNGASTSSISISQEGTYSVHATGLCIDAQASMTVSEGYCDPLVFVPNAFTPNGDDDNEFFQVSVYGHLRDFTLMVFDRWGLLIHSANDPSITWDGTFGGQPVPDGVYVWKVRYRTMTDAGAVGRELIGHVTVLR